MSELLTISEIHGIYADAFLTDDSNHLLFLSVWGRDTAMQEFLARLQLSKSENGIKDFYIKGQEINQYVIIPGVDILDKTMAKISNTLFGELTQLWIYDKIAVSADIANHRALMLSVDGGNPDPWLVIKNVCPLPLLDEWKNSFIKRCLDEKWIYNLDGFNVNGCFVNFNDEEVEPVVSEMIQRGQLNLNHIHI